MLDFEFIRDNWLYIASGIGQTLGIVIVSFILAGPLALIVTRGRLSTLLPFKTLSSLYVVLIDGIPLLLQIPFIFLLLPQFGIILPGFWAGVTVLVINYSSRMSEILYTRLTATGKNQAKTWPSLTSPLANEFTNMIKDSTLISLGGLIYDVYWRAQRVGRAEFRNLEALVIAAIVYLILITVITLSAKVLRARWTRPEFGTEGSI